MRGCLYDLSPTRKETSYIDQTRGLFNALNAKLNKVLVSCYKLCKPLKG